MYCRHCGSADQNGRFCRTCGRPLEELPAVSTEEGIQAGYAAPAVQAPPAYGAPPPQMQTAVGTPNAAMPVHAGVESGAYPVPYPQAPAIQNNTNVNVAVAGPQIMFQDKTGHNLFVRALWFVFFGWWIGEFWLLTAWTLNLTVVGLPLGLIMLNKLPAVMTLKTQSTQLTVQSNADGSYTVTREHIQQHPLWLRAVYFVCVGWWASLLWTELAYLLCIGVITMPIGFVMFDRIPVVTTLAKY
jgi:uncharacterized membrane protein YccF (DUF307 family)